MKNVIVGIWDFNNPEDVTTWLYHGVTKEKALISFIKQYIDHNYNDWTYPDKLEGIYNSNVIKDRILFDISDDIVIYAQNA